MLRCCACWRRRTWTRVGLGPLGLVGDGRSTWSSTYVRGCLAEGDAARLTEAGAPTFTAGTGGAEILIWATA